MLVEFADAAIEAAHNEGADPDGDMDAVISGPRLTASEWADIGNEIHRIIAALTPPADLNGLIERLNARAAKVRSYIASSQIVIDYLAPEMAKFDAREPPWDTYTVRMSVDHQSSIRTQTKEAEELEEAAAALTRLAAERDAAQERFISALEAFRQEGDWTEETNSAFLAAIQLIRGMDDGA